jgi:lysophospholipase L1-like esterase
VLGTTVGGDPTKINGVTVPLGDQYALIPTEIGAIEAARTAFNATVKNMADANPDRLALADVNKAFADFVTARALVYNNITITPNIDPPTGVFSEDGVHANSRGYAYISNIFIEAINAKFGSSIPLTNLSKYRATALPIP